MLALVPRASQQRPAVTVAALSRQRSSSLSRLPSLQMAHCWWLMLARIGFGASTRTGSSRLLLGLELLAIEVMAD
jgi:hypothetical protein